jgi:hypothetical protein
MRIRFPAASRALALVVLSFVSGVPPTSASEPRPYSLRKDSEFEYGCFGPCACPILVRSGVSGGFLLSPRGYDGLFYVYDVTGVDWVVPNGGDGVPVTGFGTYRFGGEFANQEQLTLALRVDGRDPRVFDSGLVAKNNTFPAIEIEIAAHAATCFDTVFSVRAEPTSLTGTTIADLSFGIHSIQPNPLLWNTVIGFSLAQAGPVRLAVFDATGRRRATLVDAAWLDAGSRSIPWSGLGDEGRPLSPGVYLVALESAGRRDVRRVIKLVSGSAGRAAFSAP